MPLDLAKLENVRVTSVGHSAACPVCRQNGSDKSGNHLSIMRDGRFNCSVGGSGNEHSKAVWQIAGVGGSGREMDTFIPAKPIVMERTWEVSDLKRLIQDHSYWINRGVERSILESLRGGTAASAQMKGRYVFPIFNSQGEIHGFAGRATYPNAEVRWKHIGKVSTWVWGDLDGVRESGRAILVEGAGCRLALATHGVKGGLTIWGTHISEAILSFLIAANPRDIVIALNNDVTNSKGRRPGQEAAEKVKWVLDKLFGEGIVRIVLPVKKDFLEHTPEDWVEWEKQLDKPVEDSQKALTSEPSGEDSID